MSTISAVPTSAPPQAAETAHHSRGGGNPRLSRDQASAAAAGVAMAKARVLLSTDQRAKVADKQIAADQAALAKATAINIKAAVQLEADGQTVDVKV